MNIFIRDADANISKENIRNLFSEFGSVTLVVSCKYTKDNKGFWWIM